MAHGTVHSVCLSLLFPFELKSERLNGNSAKNQSPNYHLDKNLEKSVERPNGKVVPQKVLQKLKKNQQLFFH